MKIGAWLIVILLCPATGFAEEVCEPAVDVAESLNVNARTDCDYEKTGLNGVVHKLLEGESQASSSSMSAIGIALESNDNQREQLSSLIASSGEMIEVRYQLLQDISKLCPSGFRVTAEEYVPKKGKLKIKLIYHCL